VPVPASSQYGHTHARRREQRVKVDLLLIAPADCRSGRLTDDGDDGLLLGQGVCVQTVRLRGPLRAWRFSVAG
jgi:hypothetical protein